MRNFNPTSPWNPSESVELSPQEYELQVVTWLKSVGDSFEDFSVNHLEYLSGEGGQYEFDAVAKFSALKGARFVILVECKKHNRPVEREDLLTLWAKLQDTNAQKAMVFATCGFQSGALEYAKSKNIATITFVSGEFTYETKSMDKSKYNPPWENFPKYSGILITKIENKILSKVIEQNNFAILLDWLFQN